MLGGLYPLHRYSIILISLNDKGFFHLFSHNKKDGADTTFQLDIHSYYYILSIFSVVKGKIVSCFRILTSHI